MAKKEALIKARVSEAMYEAIKLHADKTDKTVSEIVREAIAHYLKEKEN